MMNENDYWYWVINSIAKHLIVTECDYNSVLSINNLTTYKRMPEEEIVGWEFYHNGEKQNIEIVQDVSLSEETLQTFKEYDRILKSCNKNSSCECEDDGENIADYSNN